MLPIPFNNPRTYPGHSGVDFPQSRGVAIPASGNGRVSHLGKNARGGFYIWVQYDNGPLVGYHHMDSHRGCPPGGSRVREGTTLGYVGSTGNSTGPHLHSEVSGFATTAGYWKFFTPSRVVGQATPTGNSQSQREEIEEDMGLFILERKDGNLAKSVYDPKTGKAVRAISKDENTAYRNANSAAVTYVTVSDKEYKDRGGF